MHWLLCGFPGRVNGDGLHLEVGFFHVNEQSPCISQNHRITHSANACPFCIALQITHLFCIALQIQIPSASLCKRMFLLHHPAHTLPLLHCTSNRCSFCITLLIHILLHLHANKRPSFITLQIPIHPARPCRQVSRRAMPSGRPAACSHDTPRATLTPPYRLHC